MATMKGPGGTYYSVVFESPAGRIGVANLEKGMSRVRVEPTFNITSLASWKQPKSENNRFSKEVSSYEVNATIAEAQAALQPPIVESLPKFDSLIDDCCTEGTNDMVGPGGTVYNVAVTLPAGRLGIANLGSGLFRIRVEPRSGVTLSLAGWNQPTYENNRFSKEVSKAALVVAVAYGFSALVSASF